MGFETIPTYPEMMPFVILAAPVWPLANPHFAS